jgi:Ca2+-binding EF-hand superfamily protein
MTGTESLSDVCDWDPLLFPRSDDMKTLLHLLAVSLVSFVPLALADAADDAGKPKDAPAAKSAPNKWSELAEKNFKAQDKDGDGFLSFDEFKGNRKKPEAIEQAEQIFKLIDTDGDKKISLKEFIYRSAEARFKQMDRDNDGKLTWDEFKGTRKPEEIEQAEQNFKRMDTNGDKTLSLEEFKAGQKPPAKPGKPAGKKSQPKAVEKQ